MPLFWSSDFFTLPCTTGSCPIPADRCIKKNKVWLTREERKTRKKWLMTLLWTCLHFQDEIDTCYPDTHISRFGNLRVTTAPQTIFVPFESGFSPIFLETFCWNTMQKYWTSLVKFYPSLDQEVEEGVCQQASVRLQTALKSFHEPIIRGCLVLKSIIQIKKCTLIYGNNSVDNLCTKVHHYERVLW